MTFRHSLDNYEGASRVLVSNKDGLPDLNFMRRHGVPALYSSTSLTSDSPSSGMTMRTRRRLDNQLVHAWEITGKRP
jgi:hypothetical protein